MKTPPFLVVADRGSVKAFAVEDTLAHGSMPRLVESFDVSAAPERYLERFSDRAGSFPNGGSNGHGNSIAERMSLDAEWEVRAFREVGHRICDLLERYRPERWGFAAPSEINSAILDQLPDEKKHHLTRVVKHDLLKVDARQLIQQFEAVNPLAA